MSKKRLHTNNRITSFLLAVLMVLQTMVGVPLVASAANTAITNGKLVFPDGLADIYYTSELKDNQDGTFTLDVAMNAQYSEIQINTHQRVTKTGTYVVERPGNYLLELWGGTGGAGSGTGGAAGYVYGKVYLTAGQTLYYSIGGNGQSTSAANAGGGANGGGPSGAQSKGNVGGGGGYSAVVLLDAGQTYNETARQSGVILVAGGGGGGGSEAAAVGGAGGQIVAGSTGVFNGVNGSGGSASYTGYAGTTTVGAIRTTQSLIYGDVSGTEPNDWYLNNTASTYPAGYGGSGNLGGGGGGAGYAGGSGGVSAHNLFGTIFGVQNSGGGGGGSSYVAPALTTALDPADAAYLENTNPNAVGGALVLTYLDKKPTDYLSSVDFSGAPSDYYAVTSATPGVSISADGSFSFNDVDLSIPEGSTKGATQQFSLTFTPKVFDGVPFAGGYDVPLFADDSGIFATFTSITPGCNTMKQIELGESCSYVNAPLNFTVVAASVQIDEPDDAFDLSRLYTDNYATYRQNLASSKAFDFIGSIGSYTVYEDTAGKPGNPCANPDKYKIGATTPFQVGFNVTLKSNAPTKAIVGSVGKTAFYKKASVFVDAPGTMTLNEITFTYEKNLRFENDTFAYTLNLSAEPQTYINETLGKINEATTLNTAYSTDPAATNTGSFTVPEGGDGYYFISLKGGKGGNGFGKTDDDGNFHKGGDGAAGYLAAGYVRLEAGETIHYVLGANGADATGTDPNAETQSTGGECSYIYKTAADGVTTSVLMVAGGGGGGGDAGTYKFFFGYLGNGGIVGISGTAEFKALTIDTNAVTVDLSYLETNKTLFNGTHGQTGSTNSLYSNCKAGSCGENGQYFIHSSVTSSVPDGVTAPSTDDTGVSGSTAGVYTECVQLDNAPEALESLHQDWLSNFTFDARLTDYFTLDTAEITFSGLDSSPIVKHTANETLTIENIHPTITHTRDNQNDPTHIISSINFTITISFHVRSGFLGGNEVPLFDATELIHLNSGNSTDIPLLAATDTANVAMPDTYLPDSTKMEVSNAYYTLGDAAIPIGNVCTITADSNPDTGTMESWQYAYVDVVELLSDPTYNGAPSVTTDYTFLYGIKPKVSADATQAAVAAPVEDALVSKTATVYVQAPVEFDLHNVEPTYPAMGDDGRYLTEALYSGQTIQIATLQAAAGYELPENITVTVGGTETFAYVYDQNTGSVTMSVADITGPIKITAATTLTLTVRYEVYDSASDSTSFKEETFSVNAGDVIPDEVPGLNLSNYESTRPGHTFTWNKDMLESDMVMPAGNATIVGYFSPNEYQLTVQYYKNNNGTLELITSKYESVFYGSAYNIPSPTEGVWDGWIPDHPIVSGTYTLDVNASNISYDAFGNMTIKVVYESTINKLNVVYIKETTVNGVTTQSTIRTVYAGQYGTGEAYPSVPTPNDVDFLNATIGYQLRIDENGGLYDKNGTFGGTMPENGVTITVIYEQQSYEITFDYNGGDVGSETTRIVQYDNLYNYDALNDETRVFPSPTKPGGFKFIGWRLLDGETGKEATDANGNPIYITDMSTVTVAGDHTLKAEWDPPVIYVVVDWGNLDFNYDPGIWDPTSHTYQYTVNQATQQTFEAKGNNTITVTNSYYDANDPANNIVSDISVYTTFSYTQDTAQSAAFFTGDIGVAFHKPDGTAITTELVHTPQGNNSLTVTVDPYLIDNDPLDIIQTGSSIVIGNCKVSISKEKPTS